MKLEAVTCKDELNDYERQLLTIATIGYGKLKAVARKTGLHAETIKDARDSRRDSSYGTLVTLRTYLKKNERKLIGEAVTLAK